MKLLIIEDSEEIVDFIRMACKIGWPDIELISTIYGKSGIELVEQESPDVVLLDLGLPDIDGFQVLSEIREFSNIPILILTVRAEESNIVKGLGLGADDYITKPFRQLELLARIKALSRRHRTFFSEGSTFVGPFEFDMTKLHVTFNNEKMDFTRTEALILYHLAINSGHVVTYERLAELLWGDRSIEYANTIKVYVSRIRKKIETDPNNPKIIVNKPGIGYLLNLRNA